MSPLGLCPVRDLTFGGHDIRRMPLYDNAYEIYRETGSIDYEILLQLKSDIESMGGEIKPGIGLNCGRAVEKIADKDYVIDSADLREAVSRIRADLEAFKRKRYSPFLFW